jgi:hypothetical protein
VDDLIPGLRQYLVEKFGDEDLEVFCADYFAHPWHPHSWRVRGDHHIFTRENVEEIINLQPVGSKAKRYQVRQVREIIQTYGL